MTRTESTRDDSTHELATAADALIERCVSRLLELPRACWQSEIDAACGPHPELADEIRERIDLLIASGLVSEPEHAADASRGDDRVIAHFRLLEELGSGGQGTVYAAEDLQLGRRVALKILPGPSALSDKARRRLQREAEALSRLDHPGICSVHAIGEAGGTPYIAMQLIDGRPLADFVSVARSTTTSSVDLATDGPVEARPARDGRRPGAERTQVLRLVALFEKIARALHVAHEAGLVHRDIKPSNIMVTRAGAPVLLDFGMAQNESGDDMTLTGVLMGTPAYMSPEQLTAKRIALDRRSDIYSLGVTLFECLTLELPFDVPTREALYQAILSKPVRDPSRINKAIPSDLRVVLETALEKDRDRRYSTAAAFAEDLRAIVESRPIAARPISSLGRLARWTRREPALAALLATLLITVPAITGLLGYQIANLADVEAARAQRREDRITSDLQRAFLDLGHIHFRASRPFFENVLRESPERPEALAGLAMLHLRAEEPEAALAVLDRAPKAVARHSALARLRADALRALGRAQDAAAIDDSLGDAPPSRPLDLFLEASRITRDKNERARHAEALDMLTRAVLASPRPRAIFLYERLQAAMLAHDEKIARETADAILAQWPENPNAILMYAEAYLHYDRSVALAALQRLVRRDPDNCSAWVYIGHIHARRHDFDRAEDALVNATTASGATWQAFVNLGLTRLNNLDVEGALQTLDEARARFPDRYEAHQSYVQALRRAGKVDEQRTALERATRLLPDDYRPWFALAKLLDRAGETEKAIDAYRATIARRPGPSEVHTRLVTALVATLQIDAARDHLEAQTRRFPKEVDFWLALSRFQSIHSERLEGAKAGALTAAERALALEETPHPRTYSTLARAHFANDDVDRAVAAQKLAVEALEKIAAPAPELDRRIRREWRDLQRIQRKRRDANEGK